MFFVAAAAVEQQGEAVRKPDFKVGGEVSAIK